MAERRTHRLTYLALFLSTVAVGNQAQGVWRILDHVCAVIWAFAWATATVSEVLERRRPRG